MHEQSLSNSGIFLVRHTTASLHRETLDNTSAYVWAATVNKNTNMQKFIFQVHPYLYTLKLPHYILRGYMPFYNFILPFNFDNFVSYNFYNFNLKDLIGRDYLFFKSAYLLF